MDYPALAEDVAAFIAAQKLGHAAIIGHSLGGKVAMTLALSAPRLVERLVVVDIAPVPRPATHLAYVEAMRGLDLASVTRRAAADALLKPRIPDDAERAFLLQNLVFGEDGLRWRINLDAIAAGMDDMAGFPAFSDAPIRARFWSCAARSPTMSRTATCRLSARLFPAYRLVTIDGAGHWLHAERTQQFLDAVTPFPCRARLR